MKKISLLLVLVLVVFSMASCGGSGSGSSSSPPGENPDVPSLIELRPSEYIAQTNSFIYIRARVLNGNGNPIENISVAFTNLSAVGNLSSTSAKTDNSGYAEVTLSSTTPGFSTVQAEVNTGTGQVRDRKTVYFSTYSLVLLPYMILEVDGELNDYTLFESTTDNQVLVTATVFNKFDQAEFGSLVTFASDWPYRIGSSATCSDGSSSCEVSFPFGNTATTDSNGQASVMVQVDPIILSSISTIMNITALADNGAIGMVTLFLEPVVVSSVTVSADPTSVETDGTSTISAGVTLNTGGPAPDGTTVSFRTTCGSITPFAQTTEGAAEATFTAPSTADTCTITATAGGRSDTVDVTVTTALKILPGSVSVVSSGSEQTVSFTISGGTPSYTTTSSDPSKAYNSALGDGIWTGASIAVKIPANVCPGTVTLNVFDSTGATTSATITIVASPIIVTPPSATICENDGTCGAGTETQQFTISGGSTPYSVTSTNVGVIPNPVGNPFTVDAVDDSITTDTTVTLTITDSCGSTKTASVLVINQP
jgi:hypothetical protein